MYVDDQKTLKYSEQVHGGRCQEPIGEDDGQFGKRKQPRVRVQPHPTFYHCHAGPQIRIAAWSPDIRMSFQSRIPSPAKPTESAQGNQPTAAVKRLLLPQAQTKPNLGASSITKPKPVASTGGANLPRLEAAKSARPIATGSGRNVATHARGASTSAAIKPPLGTHASSEHAPRQTPGTSLERGPTSSAAQQHKRTLSAHASTRAIAPSQGSSLPKSVPTARVTRDHGNAATSNLSAVPRPNFDTYKQHFSPQKGKQPVSTTTSKGATSTSGSAVACSDHPRFNDELLQLALLHEGSTAALQSYQTTIKSHLQSHYADLERKYQQIESRERDRHARENLRGLRRWINENTGGGEEGFDSLSVLVECVQELDEMNKDHGAFAVAMRQFNDWQTKATCVTSSRADTETDITLQFVVPLGSEWSHAIEFIERRVRICIKTLRVFEKRDEDATIGTMIAMFSTFSEQVLQEISICKRLERLILQQQQQWIDWSIEKALMTVENEGLQDHRPTQRRGVWEGVGDRH